MRATDDTKRGPLLRAKPARRVIARKVPVILEEKPQGEFLHEFGVATAKVSRNPVH
jgi:hypothetical protein